MFSVTKLTLQTTIKTMLVKYMNCKLTSNFQLHQLFGLVLAQRESTPSDENVFLCNLPYPYVSAEKYFFRILEELDKEKETVFVTIDTNFT